LRPPQNGIGLGEPYKAWNTHVSKFAHPTSALVVGFIHQTDAGRHYQNNCTTLGLYYCGQCVIVLEKLVSSIHGALGVTSIGPITNLGVKAKARLLA
jgi:hypothetical protein